VTDGDLFTIAPGARSPTFNVCRTQVFWLLSRLLYGRVIYRMRVVSCADARL